MKALNNKKGTFRLFFLILVVLLAATIYGALNDLFYFKHPVLIAGKIEKVLPETELVTQHVTRHYWLVVIAYSSASGKTYQFVGNQQYFSEPMKGETVSVTYDADSPDHAKITSTFPQYPLFLIVIFLEIGLLVVFNLTIFRKRTQKVK